MAVYNLRSQGKLIDLRVSTVPTLHGESLVLRILDKQRVNLDLNALGFDDKAKKQLLDILALPHGIILVTGPPAAAKPPHSMPPCKISIHRRRKS